MPKKHKFGFVTRSDITKPKRSAKPKGLTDDRLHELECRACPLNRARVNSPKMEPNGSPHLGGLYILGESPSERDDQLGEPFSGSDAKRLKAVIPTHIWKKTRRNNVIRDFRPGNPDPDRTMIECCRPSIERDILQHRPNVVIALGRVAANWFGLKGSTAFLRGRSFSHQIGDHSFWVYTAYRPSYVMSQESRYDDPHADVFKRDIKRALRTMRDGIDPHVWTEAELAADTDIISGGSAGDLNLVLRALKAFSKGDWTSIDIETSKLRPYSSKSKILTVALSDGTYTLAFALDHRQAGWSPTQLKKLKRAFAKFLKSPTIKVAQNAKFELEWLATEFGKWVLFESRWECTIAQGYCLDTRRGGHGLGFLTKMHLGINIKSISSLDMEALDDESVGDVLRYNGIDAFSTAVLFEAQGHLITSKKLEDIYQDHVSRIPSLVSAQMQGVVIDQDVIDRLRTEFDDERQKHLKAIKANRDVQRFEARKGIFNVNSNPQTIQFFDYMRLSEYLKTEEGGRTTKEDHLSKVPHPVAELMLKYRKMQKLVSTYVEPLRMGSANCVVHEDGCLHTNYNHEGTISNRLSSSDPNLQNFPKRDPVQRLLRKAVVARPKHRLIAIDEGQIEARVIAMDSEDIVFCRALWDRYDIHGEWAQRLNAMYSKLEPRHGGMKALRGAVKNKFVFPAFYLAAEKSIAGYMEMPVSIAKKAFRQFWSELKGVKRWQKRLLREYARQGYVEGLNGFRYRGPLTQFQICNLPIQGTAAKITLDAMAELAVASYEEDWPAINPLLNVHDDLTFEAPEDEVDHAIEFIVPCMIKPRYDWINVPLCVEVEVGENWHDMKSVGDYYSDEMGLGPNKPNFLN